MEESGKKLSKKFNFDFSSPLKSQVNIEVLKKFLEKDSKAVLIFYGGEPLLEIEKIKEIIDSVDVPFRMQTNGLLLDKLPIEYIKKIKKILISIDGTKERTDFNRGKGTYDKIMSNIELMKKQNYDGEIIARMTLSQDAPDIYEPVVSLIENGFTSIHWQIDCGFYESDFEFEKFSRFADEYNKSLSKLIRFWIDELKKGNFLRIYPFVGIVDSILKQKKTFLRCGAGHSGYAIDTGGKIFACPIMNCIKDFETGNIKNSNPKNLKKFYVGGKCLDCEIKDLCGGRCLYWNKSELWPKKGDELICKTIKHLISELKKNIPEIRELICKKIIPSDIFEYEKYFGPEIIP